MKNLPTGRNVNFSLQTKEKGSIGPHNFLAGGQNFNNIRYQKNHEKKTRQLTIDSITNLKSYGKLPNFYEIELNSN